MSCYCCFFFFCFFFQAEDGIRDAQESRGLGDVYKRQIYDTMQFIKPNVSTICIGQAASMGAVLLAGGAKGKRYSLPNSRVMIHQPISGYQGQASDIDIHAKEVLSLRSRLNGILAKHTRKTVKQIAKDTDRDNYMDPEQSKEYGLIDVIISDRNNIRNIKD